MTSSQTKKGHLSKISFRKMSSKCKILNWVLDANPHYHVLCCTIRCKFAVLLLYLVLAKCFKPLILLDLFIHALHRRDYPIRSFIFFQGFSNMPTCYLLQVSHYESSHCFSYNFIKWVYIGFSLGLCILFLHEILERLHFCFFQILSNICINI